MKGPGMRWAGLVFIIITIFAPANFHFVSIAVRDEIKIKNLWRRKCVRRAIFRKVGVRVEGDFAPFNSYFVCNTSNCVTVRPVRGHLTPKMNIAFSVKNLMLNIFYSTIFSKKAAFSEKTAKNCFGGAFDNFLGKEGVLQPKINITF